MDLEKELSAWMSHPLVSKAMHLLRTKTPAGLFYHVPAHTDDVIHEVLLFANTDGLSVEDRELLVIAAAFHDLGFLDRARENEALGAKYAVEAMHTDSTFSQQQIELVETMILDTELRMTSEGPKQIATTELSKYLCDADVSNLGRDDFFEKAELVRKEIGIPDQPTFLSGLMKFLEAHEWYSNAAQALRGKKKMENLELLRVRLNPDLLC